jgi:hypothetical protein
MNIREEVIKAVETLPEETLHSVLDYVRFVQYQEEEYDDQYLTTEDLDAIQRGKEDIKEGRYLTLEEYRSGKRF